MRGHYQNEIKNKKTNREKKNEIKEELTTIGRT